MPDPIPAPAPGADTATPPVAPAAPAAPAAPWYQGADAELIGHVQNRGWDKLTPAEAALEAVKAQREAAAFVGIPQDQIARIPKDANDVEGWKALNQRLGAPADPAGYKLDGVKFSDGTLASEEFQTYVRDEIAVPLGLSTDKAIQVAQAMAKYIETAAGVENADAEAVKAAELTSLRGNWGANFDANMAVANNAAEKLGVTSDEMQALVTGLGGARTAEIFRTIGSKIGEDAFITNANPAVPGVMTKEQAVARKEELFKDDNWVKKYQAGGAAENRELQAILSIIIA